MNVLTLNCAKRGDVHSLLQAVSNTYQHTILHLQEPNEESLALTGFRHYLPTHIDATGPPNLRFRAVTYVADAIPPSAVTQISCPCKDLVVLHITDETGQAARFVNIYNDGSTQDGLLTLTDAWQGFQPAPRGLHLSGDFNLHHPLWAGAHRQLKSTDLAKAEGLLDFIQAASLQLLMDPGLPTFTRKGTTIDLAFGRGHLAAASLGTTLVEDTYNSDHNALSTAYTGLFTNPVSPDTVFFKQIDWESFRDQLTLSAASLPPVPGSVDGAPRTRLDACADALEQAILETARQAAPKRNPKAHYHPWWSGELSNLHQTASSARRALNREPNNPTFRARHRQASARLKHSLKQSKKDYAEQRLTTATRTNFWHIYRELDMHGARAALKPLAKPDGTLTTGPQEAAELLATTWFPNGDAHRPPRQTYTPEEEMWRRERTRHSRRTTPELSPQEVQKAVFEAESHSAAPKGSFPAIVLQEAWPVVSHYVTTLFRACLVHSHHPLAWKTAQVRAVPKPGKTTYGTVKSYRPIALLPVLSKALEKIMAHRLTHYACEGALPPEHHGGLPSHSREQALLTVTEQIKAHHRARKACVLVKTDITSAFDQASHKEICRALSRRGIPPHEVGYIRSFLARRAVDVQVADVSVRRSSLQRGVPQGSPLSPILWLFYTADLLELLRGHDCLTVGWLDDVTLLTAGQTPAEAGNKATQALRKASWWSKHTGSMFAPEKCESMLMKRKRNRSPWEVALDGSPLPQVDSLTLLGVIVSTNLSPRRHVLKRVQVATNTLNALRRLSTQRGGLSYALMRRVCMSVVLEQLDSGCISWFRHDAYRQQAFITLLDTVQLRCAQLISGGYRSAGVAALEYECDLIPTQLRLQEKSLRFAAKAQTLPHTHGFAAVWELSCSTTVHRYPSTLASFQQSYPWPEQVEVINKGIQAPWQETLPAGLDIAANRGDAADNILTGVSRPDASTWSIYTDGSVVADYAGAGARIEAGQLVSTHSWPLRPGITVFVSELCALAYALLEVERLLEATASKPAEIIVLADNQAALTRALTPKAAPGQAQQLVTRSILQRLLTTHSDVQVTLKWVPGHEGIEGNERADLAAKAAAGVAQADMDDIRDREALTDYSGDTAMDGTCAAALKTCLRDPAWRISPPPVPPPSISLPFLHTQIRKTIQQQRVQLWQHGSQAQALRRVTQRDPGSFQQRLHLRLSKAESSLLTQLRTNRIGLAAPLFRIGRANSDLCACGKRENRAHFLFHCPLLEAQRQILRRRVGRRRAGSISSLLSSTPTIYATLEFAFAAERFDGYRSPGDVTDERFEQG